MPSIDIPKTSGIYRIVCTATGKSYIGSAINLYARRNQHFCALRHGTHANPKLQCAWNKYREDAFVFEIIEYVLTPELLTAREQFWFTKLKPFDKNGFNIARDATSTLGVKASEATRKKLSAEHASRKYSEEAKRNMGLAQKGKTLSPEARERIRLKALGRKQSDETRRKRAEKRRGQKHSPKTIEKMCLAQQGHPVRESTRDKLRIANIGKPQDPESHAFQMKTLIVIDPRGIEYHIRGIKRFCREHHLNYRTLSQVSQGKFTNHKGWTVKPPESDVS